MMLMPLYANCHLSITVQMAQKAGGKKPGKPKNIRGFAWFNCSHILGCPVELIMSNTMGICCFPLTTIHTQLYFVAAPYFCFENHSLDASLVGLSTKRLHPTLPKRWACDPTWVMIHIECSLFKELGGFLLPRSLKLLWCSPHACFSNSLVCEILLSFQ